MDEHKLRLALGKLISASQREGRLNQKLIGVKDQETYNAFKDEFGKALRIRTHLQEDLIKTILTEGGPMGEE